MIAGRPEGGSWLWGVGADGCPAKDTWTSTPLGPGEVTLFGRRVFANVTTLSSETSVLKRERQREIRHRAEGHVKTRQRLERGATGHGTPAASEGRKMLCRSRRKSFGSAGASMLTQGYDAGLVASGTVRNELPLFGIAGRVAICRGRPGTRAYRFSSRP